MISRCENKLKIRIKSSLLLVSTFVAGALFFTSCGNNKKAEHEEKESSTSKVAISDDSLLTKVQYQTFQYFWENAEPNSGLARERTHMDNKYPQNDKNVVTIGGSGFGIMAILVGIERSFITREQGLERFERMVKFLDAADRFHGAWPHWLNADGTTKPFSKMDDGGDLVESAFLIQGLLSVREYFKDGNDREKAVASKIDKMWKEVEWSWYTKGEDVLYWHWSPNYEWKMNFPVGGYNECLVMYVLAASSPTYPITKEVYEKGWARNDSISMDTVFMGLRTGVDHYETNNDPVGPLFWAHYSYLGLDPRNLKDQHTDYWQATKNHALIDYKYCVENPKGYEGYGPNCWGLTSSYSINGYAGHHPVAEDLGVISPTAALSSFPYTPDESMAFLKYLYNDADSLVGEYGPYDAFSISSDWYVPHYLAIDQGPIPVMIENYRSGLLWNLFMQAPEVQHGLQELGFEYAKSE